MLRLMWCVGSTAFLKWTQIGINTCLATGYWAIWETIDLSVFICNIEQYFWKSKHAGHLKTWIVVCSLEKNIQEGALSACNESVSCHFDHLSWKRKLTAQISNIAKTNLWSTCRRKGMSNAIYSETNTVENRIVLLLLRWVYIWVQCCWSYYLWVAPFYSSFYLDYNKLSFVNSCELNRTT